MTSTFFGMSWPDVGSRPVDRTANRASLLVEPLAVSQWRVCDSRWPERHANRLLGFIEITKNGSFEVMQLANGFEWFTYASLDEATAHFVDAMPVHALTNSAPQVGIDAEADLLSGSAAGA